ncbi:MAG: hypothetical protein GY781_14610 [Gammaproteobacteria bacterium]|nr:hypothetical protein [Gammaproteobacteria bacterium]
MSIKSNRLTTVAGLFLLLFSKSAFAVNSDIKQIVSSDYQNYLKPLFPVKQRHQLLMMVL